MKETDPDPFNQGSIADYDDELNRGLSLSGEDKAYFIEGRLASLKRRLGPPDTPPPAHILDYGCGTGETTLRLADLWPDARVVGVDVSASLLSAARAAAPGHDRCDFQPLEAVPARRTFDLVYCNGVFHHIRPAQRPAVLDWIRSRMTHSGRFALWENNSWNPGTRWVMRRIPFDRDADLLSPTAAVRLLKRHGFAVQSLDFAFVFPRCLRLLRPVESWLRRLPLGAQYQVISRPDPSPPA
jgi:SAM-dependent methyltransferase